LVKFAKTRYQSLQCYQNRLAKLPKAKMLPIISILVHENFTKNYRAKKNLILQSDAIVKIYVFIKTKDFAQCVEGHSMEFGTILEYV
jgi:hypothetical protein